MPEDDSDLATAPAAVSDAAPSALVATADGDTSDGTGASAAALDAPWRSPALPVADRVKDLMARMSLAQKLGQLTSIWLGSNASAGQVAPMQADGGSGRTRSRPCWPATGSAS